MIGGGGSGNIAGGGGGGAGGAYIDNNFTYKKNSTYKLKVGTGGSMIMNNSLIRSQRLIKKRESIFDYFVGDIFIIIIIINFQ